MDACDEETDIWERLGISCGGYNSAVDQQIYDVAKCIIEASREGKGVYNTELAEQLSISREHAELIQYILASVCYADRPHGKKQPFTYGTSPRGLFVDDIECAERFLAEFDLHMKSWEEPN